jgi:hypothetical protein
MPPDICEPTFNESVFFELRQTAAVLKRANVIAGLDTLLVRMAFCK